MKRVAEWFIRRGVLYSVVFVLSLPLEIFLVHRLGSSLLEGSEVTVSSIWQKAIESGNVFLGLVVILVHFSPSLSVIMVSVLLRSERVRNVLTDLLLYSTLKMSSIFLRVQLLAYDDDKALDLIATFRGRYITWVEGTGDIPREIDKYDTQSTTYHVAVFLWTPWKDILIGYGRLLFGAAQMLEKYRHVLGNSFVNPDRAVEVSRLLVVPNIKGHAIRGTLLSVLVQLHIYRKFFQACESNETKEWWAVLGPGLHRLLRSKYGFPFERVDRRLKGKDAKGTYYAVRMFVYQARLSVQSQHPLLYKWFLEVEQTPIIFTRMNGRQVVPAHTGTLEAEAN